MPDKTELFLAYLKDKPNDRFAMYGLAFEHEKAGRLDESISSYRALLNVHPGAGAGWLRLGQVLVATGQVDAGQAAWRSGQEALRGASDAESRRSISEIQAALDALDDD